MWGIAPELRNCLTCHLVAKQDSSDGNNQLTAPITESTNQQVAEEQQSTPQPLTSSRVFGDKHALRLWLLGLVTPTCNMTMGNSGFVNRAALSGAGDRMVTLPKKGHVTNCYNPANGDLLWEYPSEKLFIPQSIVMHGSGNRVAIIPHGYGSVVLLDGHTGKLIKKLEMNMPICLATFNHAGTQLATASRDGIVQLWKTEDGASVYDFQTHNFQTDNYNMVTLNYDEPDKQIVCGLPDGFITVCPIDGTRKAAWLGHNGPVFSAQFSGNKIVSGSADKTARIWDIATLHCLFSFKHKYPVRNATISPDGNTLATTDGKRITTLWDLRNGNRVEQFVNTINMKQCALLGDIREAAIVHKSCPMDTHPLKQVWMAMPKEISGLVERYTKTKDLA